MLLLANLIHLASEAAYALILAAIILSMVGQATRARWLYHPLVRLVIALGLGICAPFRQLMKRAGLPTAPLDLSPMLALFAIQITERVLIGILLGGG